MIEIEIDGEEALQEDLKGLASDLSDIPTMSEISKDYVRVTSSLAPVRTGFLANSIRPSTKDNMAGAVALAPYASVINYGSPDRGIRPTYYMNKADNILNARVHKLVEEGVDELIEERDLDE